jgi:hypothetical protein
MRVIVLKARQKKNLEELDLVIERGRTLEEDLHDAPEPGGWKMLKDARPGDMAVWYAASPDQEYRAWGWIVGRPVPSPAQSGIFFGPVAGVRRLTPASRLKVAEASGFNRDGVNQRAEEVRWRADEFLLAVGIDKKIVRNRELISAEIARVLQ